MIFTTKARRPCSVWQNNLENTFFTAGGDGGGGRRAITKEPLEWVSQTAACCCGESEHFCEEQKAQKMFSRERILCFLSIKSGANYHTKI